MPSDDHFEKHIEVNDSGKTAVQLIAESTSLSKQVIKQAMTKGAVWLSRDKHTQRLRRASRTLRPGDTLHLYYDAELLATKPVEAILISDEADYSIWYKPCGLLSQGSKWSDHCTITRWVSQHLKPERPAFIVHRLDRAASGLILVAHSKKATTALAELFQSRQIEKNYEAIVTGLFPADPAIMTIAAPIDDRHAISHIKLIKYSAKRDCSLVNINIETGRKHQIRRHLAEAGFPILGDRLYGGAQETALDLQLTAVSLAFTCPITGKLRQYSLENKLHPQL